MPHVVKPRIKGQLLEQGISVVIPVGPNENSLGQLAQYLKYFPHDAVEFIFALGEAGAEKLDKQGIESELSAYSLTWLNGKTGRAHQQNDGASVATRQWLWFLHLDSVFDQVLCDVLVALSKKASIETLQLFCFLLGFYDGGKCLKWNSRGANVRTRFLKLPFGDQGFFLSQKSFERLGGFDKSLTYGEDHCLAWKMMQLRGKTVLLNQTLQTSARKYQQNGWVRQSWRHQYLWWRQALPEFFKLVCMRFANKS